MLQPQFVQIIDAGTIPLHNSISHIVMHLEKHPNIGGACGEIEVLIPDKKDNGEQFGVLENMLMEAQYVEYKLSHYIDKQCESLFGFISVLPGAFSTFRWEAIYGDPLNAFLKGIMQEMDAKFIPNCAEANMYLAEDRIFCLELLIKKNQSYILSYISGCKAITDPPYDLIQLLKQ